MSSNPQPEANPVMAAPADPPEWHRKLFALLAVIFCFEMGVFLLIFPWVSEWDLNYFSRLPVWAREIWISPYFRGAVSGLGAVNIYISFAEVVRLRRFSE